MDHHHHLSQIATQWSIVRRAHGDTGDGRHAAQRALFERYGGAVRRYLLASLRDVDAADEVFQDFALRFVRGDFRSADPAHGKFRAFLKTIISRMVTDYHRRKQRRNRREVLTQGELPDAADTAENGREGDVDFAASWREELLARSWEHLREAERSEGSSSYKILRCRVEHPNAKSHELAGLLSETMGKALTASNVRVMVHRARDKFAGFLMDEVAGSLDDGSFDQLEQELIDLGLHDYCRDMLERMR